MPRYRVAREWRDYVIAIDVVSCHSIRMVKAGVVDASRASKRRARAQKACEQGHVHALEVMNQLKSVKRKRRSYTAGLRSFAGCFGTRTVNDAGCPHGRAAHAPPKYCCKVYAAFCLRGGVHIRATASMTRADKAIALDLERVDCNEASDCELLEVRATLISRSGAILDEQCLTFVSGQGASPDDDARPIDDHPGDVSSGASGDCPAAHSGTELHAIGSEGGGLMTQDQQDRSASMQQTVVQPALAAG